MNVSPYTGFMRKVANSPDKRGLAHTSNLHPILSRGITPGLHSVAQLICLFQEPTRVSILGACCLGVFLSVLDSEASCLRKHHLCLASFQSAGSALLSVVRVLSLKHVRVVADFRLLIFPISCLDTTDSKLLLSVPASLHNVRPEGTDFTISHFRSRGLDE